MPWWGLPTELFAVWLLWLLAAAAGRAVADARRGIPGGRRGGVSAGFLIVAPPFFWGVALVGDLAAAPWGTRVVGAIHAVLGALFLVSLLRDARALRSLDGPA